MVAGALLVLVVQTTVTLHAVGQAQGDLRFDFLSVEQGLSSVRVWDILQDRQGFLWVATGDGLNRYDGHTVTIFRAGGPGTISHDQVWALCEDDTGTLWVGTYYGGLNRFDAATQTFTHYRHNPDDPTSLGDDRIRTIHASLREPGILWIGTYGGGIDRFDTRTETFTHYRHNPDDPTSLPDDVVSALYEDRAGTLWAGTRGGLSRIVYRDAGGQATGAASPASDTISFTTYPPPPHRERPVQSVYVTSILEDHTGILWVGTYEEGLNRFDRSTGTFTRFGHDPDEPTSLSHNDVLSLMEDREGMLWVGTYGGGLNRFDRSTGSFIHLLNDSADQQHTIVRDIYQDRSGVVWAGTFRGGMVKIRRDKFVTYRHEAGNPNSLLPGWVNAVAEDREGELWVAMLDGGLTHISRPKGQAPVYRHYPQHPQDPDTLSHPQVIAILESHQEPGIMWLGTEGGLDRLDRRTGVITHYLYDLDDPTRLGDASVLSILESRCEPGVLWLGTSHGVSRFDERYGTFRQVFSAGYDSDRKLVRHLLPSASEPCAVWFSVRDQGLYKLSAVPPASETMASAPRSYAVEHYPYDRGTQENTVEPDWELWAQTNDGRLWLSDYTALYAFDPETESYTSYTVEDGLPSNQVASVLLDDEGLLWIAGSQGLTQMDPDAGVMYTFDFIDDLHNMLERRAAARGPGGTLYFGGRDGVTEIHPDLIQDNTAIPPVVLTGFRLNGQPVPIASGDTDGTFTLPRHIGKTRALVLPPGVRGLTFEFAALDFMAPEENQYAYRMEGFDEDWTQAGTQRMATYTNLDPGQYVFHVRAANNDGVWNEDGTRLSITILPPWYRTRWSYASLVLLVVGSIVGFIYVRERSLRRQTRILETTVAERTEQLAQQTEALRKANAFKSRFLTNISHEFRTPLTLTLGPINDVLAGRHGVDQASLPHFERARRNGRRLLRLINQLLELARLDAGALHLEARRDDLARHLRDIATLFQDIAQQHRLRFTVNVPTEPVWHVFDADKVENVVVNLLSNAIKFTPPEGTISLGLMQEDDGTAHLTVADTGQGIPEAHLPRLFDRFYQVDSAATRRHEGSGIGLALVKELVTLHEGWIMVESTPGVGTRFDLFLPVLEATAAPVTTAADDGLDALPNPLPQATLLAEDLNRAHTEDEDRSAPDLNDTVVLVVEDNADMRAYIRAHLEPDYHVVEATHGTAGLALAQQWVPDLVLSDVMMPEMDGLELCAALKNDVRTSHIPVTLLTAKAEVEHRIAGFESGADAYLPKPFDAEELRVRVRTLIEERRRLRLLFGAGQASAGGEARPVLPPQEAAFLAQVETVLEEHLSDTTFGVDQLAEAVYMSRRQLLRKLKALTNESPSELLNRGRMAKAGALLREGFSAKEVAYEVGFKSYSSFSRAFKSFHGTPPSAFGQEA